MDSSVVTVPRVLVIGKSRVRVPAGAAGEFSSPTSTFCIGSCFGTRSTPSVTAVEKDPCHYARRAGGRLQVNTLAP